MATDNFAESFKYYNDGLRVIYDHNLKPEAIKMRYSGWGPTVVVGRHQMYKVLIGLGAHDDKFTFDMAVDEAFDILSKHIDRFVDDKILETKRPSIKEMIDMVFDTGILFSNPCEVYSPYIKSDL